MNYSLSILWGEQYRQIEQQNFLKLLIDNRKIFKEAYEQFCLIVTIPSTSILVEQSFSFYIQSLPLGMDHATDLIDLFSTNIPNIIDLKIPIVIEQNIN